MKFFLWSMMTVACMGLSINTQARQLPLEQISDPGCKALHRSDHNSDCKLPFSLPDQTVFSLAGNSTEKLLFSVLYKWSYHNGHKTTWWHPGLDIVSAKGTPLVSIADGEVIKAQTINGYGKTVVVKHTTARETIYANYAHMDTIWVEVGQLVKEWQKLWEIGNTGFTMWALGNHVDFQITKDISPSHPYGHTACSAGYRDATQTWVCNHTLDMYTYDPYEFLLDKLETQEQLIDMTSQTLLDSIDVDASSSPDELEISFAALRDEMGALVDTASSYVQGKVQQDSKSALESFYEVEALADTLSDQASTQGDTKEKELGIYANVSSTMTQVDQFNKLLIEVFDGETLVQWALQESIWIDYRPALLQFYTDEIHTVIWGKKQLLFKGIAPGKTQINIMMWDTKIKSIPIVIQ